ncbi:DUF3644 domain-containing protein [bacterium]|jgi:hypothetical protein|nr:DUF3644 domain-containing protein [bacterium]
MLAAIEIYNKPQISYRDECFTILLINAWELLLKSILSKNKKRIFYPKERKQNYRSLTIQDALNKVQPVFPIDIQYEPIAQNLELLITYRNNAIHFYNQKGFSIVIYGLAQTNITNFRDLMISVFKYDITDEMSINLLPLSFGTSPDPIEFIQKSKNHPCKNKAVAQFLKEISQITTSLERQNLDTSRFLTTFNVTLRSVKKISSADVVVGVKGEVSSDGPLLIERRVDPNKSHPLRQSQLMKNIGSQFKGVKFTTFTLQAIVWKYDFRNKPHLYWRPSLGGVIQYSNEVLPFLNALTKEQIEAAVFEFKKTRKKKKNSTNIKT